MIFILLWGTTIPVKHVVTVEERINAPIDRVWSIMTDWENQESWRSEVNKVVVISPTKFIEYAKNGPAITFEVVESQKPYYFELVMTGSVRGSYIATLSFLEGVTTVTAKETIFNDSVIGRVISRLFFDLEEFAKNYLLQLKTHAESTRS